ncbi:MAG TPA: ATP-grasp domain-containing protein [Gaiellaceae bacterium]|nr:ATP-grasp domain-containing protein [Gaiellaceae bacterium]
MIRSLGRRGIHVVAADSNPRSPGFRSRYAAERLVYPPPTIDGQATVTALARAASERRIDLVIPVGEGTTVLVSGARERFGDGTVLALPDAEAFETARDKLATVELAARLGVPTPRTILVRTAAEALRHAADLRWPVVLKPQASRKVLERGEMEAFGVEYAADGTALAAQMAPLEGHCAVLLQEYCRGEGHGVGLLMDRGQPLLAFQHRRLREVPFTGGPSSLRDSVPLDPVLFEHSARLLEALHWTGPAMVEFKVGPEGPSLMEINGRLWGSLALAVKSGVDFPGRIVDVFLSPLTEPAAGRDFGYAVGVRSRDLGLELSWIASVLAPRSAHPFLEAPRRREAAAAALRLFDPRDGFDVLDAGDPMPGLAEVAGIAAKVPRHLGRALRRFSLPGAARPETRAQSR